MKKYKVLAVSKYSQETALAEGINIGDYIQGLAARQFLPQCDGYLDRDYDLKKCNEPCNVIMNGWFMHCPDNWPPSKVINPLFVALHINSGFKDKLLTEEGIEYLKQHQPIGCRDQYTRDILKSVGIEAYFSGCLTLTLGKNYGRSSHDGTIIIVDPVVVGGTSKIKDILKIIGTICHHPMDYYKLLCNRDLNVDKSKYGLRRAAKVALYLANYSKLFSWELLTHATYVTQQHPQYRDKFNTEKSRFEEAARLLKMYSKARLVITSRIHCALPCLGMGTDVIFLQKENDSLGSNCRFGLLVNLLNSASVTSFGIRPNFNISGIISRLNYPKNRDDWKSYAKDLSERCQKFINH